MNELKVLFVGVGSIAKRHIRNLHAIGEKIGLAISIDAFRRRSSTAPIDGIKNEFTKISDVPCDYDIVFITNQQFTTFLKNKNTNSISCSII